MVGEVLWLSWVDGGVKVLVGLSKGLWAVWKREWALALVLCSVGALGVGVTVAVPPFTLLTGWFTDVDYSFRGNIAVNLTASESMFSQPLGECTVIAIYLYAPGQPQQVPVTLVVRNGSGGGDCNVDESD